MARKSKKKIGEILIEQGSATQDQIVAAVLESKDYGKRVGEVLVEQGVCTEEQIARALADQFGVEFVDLMKPEAATKIDRSLLKTDLQKKYTMVPMRKERNTLLLLVHDPSDVDALDTIGITAGKTDIGGIASRTQLAEYISGGSAGVDLNSQLVTSSLDRSRDSSKDSSRDSSKDASRDSSLDAVQIGAPIRVIFEATAEAGLKLPQAVLV